jgi:two-component system chemotaxis response regulator CheB
MNTKSKLPVSVAKQGELLQKGRIYFAPDDGNLIINLKSYFEIKRDGGHFFPSIDATFCSIPKQLAPQTIAILLTGMGSDGAKGLKTVADAGGLTIAQDELGCIIFGMPKVAIEMGAAKKILTLDAIAQLLCSLT